MLAIGNGYGDTVDARACFAGVSTHAESAVARVLRRFSGLPPSLEAMRAAAGGGAPGAAALS